MSVEGLPLVLNKERLDRGLTDWFEERVTYTHYEFISGTGKGDSYLSDNKRIKIHGVNKDNAPKHVQVLLKKIPDCTSRRLTLRSDELFRNEINYYKVVLPALLKFQASKNLKDPFTNYARIFLASDICDGINDIICLEDLTVYQFQMAVRQEGIDFAHIKITIKSLAQFHAMSFAMRDQEPREFNKIKHAIFECVFDEKLWYWYERFWKNLCRIAIDAVEKEYPESNYLEKIKEYAVPGRYEDLIRAVKSTFKTGVISHGDGWSNNFLYKYGNNDVPVDMKFVDFQLTRCASPVLDLSYVIYACTTQELRLKHYDELLKYYYDVLSTQITGMGSDPSELYSWETFMKEVKNYSYFGLGFSLISMPFLVLGPDDSIDGLEMKGDVKLNVDDVWRLRPIKTKEGRLREANNIVHCVDNGYI